MSVMKIVRPALEIKASKEEEKCRVSVLVDEGAGRCKIHLHMSAVYGKQCMSLSDQLV